MKNNTHATSSAQPPFAIAIPVESQRQDLAFAPLQPNGSASQPLTFLKLMRGLKRRWRSATFLGLLIGAVAAGAVWLFLPPSKPFAFAKIEFPSSPERTLNEHPDPPLKEQTQKERILSRKMLTKVIARPEIAELETIREQGDPIAYLSRELVIEFAPGSEIMRIALYGDRPADLEILVNAVKDTYLQDITDESERRRNNRESDLRIKHAKAEGDYKRALDEAIKNGLGISGINPEAAAAIQRRVEDQRDDAEASLKITQKRLEKMNRDLTALTSKQSDPIEMNNPDHTAMFLTDEEVVLFTKQRKDMERVLIERRRQVDKESPLLKDLEADILAVQAKLDSRKRELRPQIEARLLVKINADIATLTEQIAEAQADEQKLTARINKLALEAKQFGDTSAKAQSHYKLLTALRDESDGIDRALKRLMSERDAPIRAKELESAIIVMPNESWRRARFSALAFVGMFGLTLLGFGFIEYRARRIASADEVVTNLGMPIMGTVPARPARVGVIPPTGPVGPEQVLWDHHINESVDSARTIFLHTADANALRVVQITSAVGGEGKTLLSCQLARSLARTGRRVLLIDGDLRRPSVHAHFGGSPLPGLGEVLRREVRFDNVIQTAPVPNLFLVSAGRCDNLALQQLAMDGFRDLLQQFRDSFDFVLIDSSPILPVADALLMARHVDGVLLSIMCDVSQLERVQTACQKLGSIGARIIGAVLHGTGEENYGYGPRFLMANAITAGA